MTESSSTLSVEDSILREAAQRVVDRSDLLACISDSADGLTRTFCSVAMKQTHQQIDEWVEPTMTTRLDAVGNLIVVDRKANHTNQSNKSKPVFLIGSHLDTVINAGKFDGPLGVLLGLAVMEVVQSAGIELAFDLEVVGFSEEEGVRYKFPFIGSLGIVGELSPQEFDRVDAGGVCLGEALKDFGCDAANLESASYRDGNAGGRTVAGFMEAHIEQAIRLQDADVAVGVVTAIAGQTRATIRFTGVAGHAGTVPHDRRHDALAAAAELILAIESIGKKTDDLFATVGNVDVKPGLSNVIPGVSELRLDLRHEFDPVRESAFAEIESTIELIAKSRGVVGKIESVQHTPATPMDQEFVSMAAQSTVETVNNGQPAQMLVSGAGHDAMIMSRIAPSCMLFVRCKDGISHHPDEFVSADDILVTLEVMGRTVIRMSASLKSKEQCLIVYELISLPVA